MRRPRRSIVVAGAVALVCTVLTAAAVVRVAQAREQRDRVFQVEEHLHEASRLLDVMLSQYDSERRGPAGGPLSGDLTELAGQLHADAELIDEGVRAEWLDFVGHVDEAAAAASAVNPDHRRHDAPQPSTVISPDGTNVVSSEQRVDGAGLPDLVELTVEASVAVDDARLLVDEELEADVNAAQLRAARVVGVTATAWGIALVAALVAWLVRKRKRQTERIEAFYRSTLDDLGGRVCRYRVADLAVVYCNAEWASAFGRTPDDLRGVSLEELLTPGEIAVLRRQLPVALGTGALTGSESRRIVDDGTVVVETWVDRVVEGPSGPEVLSVGRDITALATAEADNRFLAQNTTEVLMRLGPDHRIRFVTPAVSEMLEHAPDDVVGAPIQLLIAAEHHDTLAELLARAESTGAPQRAILEAAAVAEGVRVWCELIVGSVVSELGEVELHATLRDVTEQLRLTDELAAGRAVLDAIIDAVPSGVIAIDQDLQVLAMNQAAATLHRVCLLPGAHIWDLDGADAEVCDDEGTPIAMSSLPLTEALGTDLPVATEAVFRYADGAPDVPFQASARRWQSPDGSSGGAVVVLHDLTDTRAAERRLRSILEAIRHGVLLHDETGRIVVANSAAAELLGRDEVAELVGLATDELLAHACDADSNALPASFAPIAETLATQRPFGPVEIGVEAGGRPRWLQLDVEPVTTDVGSGTAVSLTDVSAEHHARAELAESETRHRSIVENLHEGLVILDQHGRIVSSNDAATRLLGLDIDQIVGRATTDPRWHMVHADGRPLDGRDHPAMVTLSTGQSVDRFVLGVHRPNGQLRWMEVTSQPLQLDDGPGVFVVFQDQTDILAANAALVESEERFRSLADGAPVPVFTIDSGGSLEYANGAFRQLLQAPFDRIAGRQWLEFLPADERVRLVWMLGRTGRSGEARLEHRLVIAEGERRWVTTTLRPVDGGERFIGTIVDLTERRELEERLAHDATHDLLTGLANRGQLLDRLDQSLRRAARNGAVPALLFCDLDHFKPINDTCGHAAGDHVLIEIARRLEHGTRDGDTVARLGGDEFVVLAEPPATDADTDALARRIKDDVMGPIELPDGTVVTVGVSIGVAAGEIGDDPTRLLARADAAVYDAKHAGRGTIVHHDARRVPAV